MCDVGECKMLCAGICVAVPCRDCNVHVASALSQTSFYHTHCTLVSSLLYCRHHAGGVPPTPGSSATGSSSSATEAGPAAGGSSKKGLVLAVTLEGACDSVMKVQLTASVKAQLLSPSMSPSVAQMVAKGELKPEDATCKEIQVR